MEIGSTKFAFIYAPDGMPLGDVTMFEDGTATVMNEWEGLQQWFDNPETGHSDALYYIRTRMVENPVFK